MGFLLSATWGVPLPWKWDTCARQVFETAEGAKMTD